MRKILTNQVGILAQEKQTISGLVEKSQGFVETRSKVFSTRRRKVCTKSWLFRLNSQNKNTPKHIISEKSLRFFTSSRHFCQNTDTLNPLRIAQKRVTDLVVKNKRKIPPEKCEKFWQNQPKINFTKEKMPQISKFSPFCLDISKKVHTFASLF